MFQGRLRAGRLSAMNEEEVIVKAYTEFMIAIGERPIRNGEITLRVNNGFLETVKTVTERRVRKPAPNNQPARTSGR